MHYEPSVLGAARVELSDARLGVERDPRRAVRGAARTEGVTPVDWNASEPLDVPLNDLTRQPATGATFAPLPPAAANPKNYAIWQKTFATWLAFRTAALELWRSGTAEGGSHSPAKTSATFRIRLMHRAHELRDEQTEKVRQNTPRGSTR
jgi:hypothetical protein